METLLEFIGGMIVLALVSFVLWVNGNIHNLANQPERSGYGPH